MAQDPRRTAYRCRKRVHWVQAGKEVNLHISTQQPVPVSGYFSFGAMEHGQGTCFLWNEYAVQLKSCRLPSVNMAGFSYGSVSYNEAMIALIVPVPYIGLPKVRPHTERF